MAGSGPGSGLIRGGSAYRKIHAASHGRNEPVTLIPAFQAASTAM
jgi:hypothetical protein